MIKDILLILIIIVIIILILILISYLYKLYNNRFSKKLKINKPSNIINNTYYKCLEKGHNEPTNNILNKYHVNRINDPEKCSLYIPCGYNNVEMELFDISQKHFNNSTIIYGIVGCDKIVSKRNIWMILERYYGRNNATILMPLTYVTDNEEHMYELNKNHKIGMKYILKKNLQRKKGLKITNSLSDMNNALNDDYKIIQKFIRDPLLINGRKLNIRIYIIIIQEKTITKIYLYKAGKCIYTNKNYVDNEYDFDNDDFERNITSYNLDNKIYLKNPLLLEDLRKYLNSSNNLKNINIDNENNLLDDENKILLGNKLINNINILIQKVCKPIKPEVCKNYENIKDNTCFQIFGGDIIVDTNLKPYLLEFNKGPSLKTDLKRDYIMKEGLIEDTFKLANVIPNNNESHLNNFIKI